MKKSNTSLLLFPISILLLYGCSDITEYRFKHEIVSVYYHEQNKYSVGIFDYGLLEIVRLPTLAPVSIWLDAPSKNEMWYECDYTYDSWDSDRTGGCSIHIYDVDNIVGAGWNHGKFGSGRTTRID